MYDILQNVNIDTKIKVPAPSIFKYKKYISQYLKNICNKCIVSGYLDSINKINMIGKGVVYQADFSGDIIFPVNFNGKLCNPKKGDIISCTVYQVSNVVDIIAKNGILVIVVICENKEIQKYNIRKGSQILVKVIASRIELLKSVIKVVALFNKVTEQPLDDTSEFIDDFDFIEN